MAEYFCTNCGYMGRGKKQVKGSIGVELVLWLFFLLPGLIYSLWRLSNVYKGCPSCKAASLIPASSPIARKMLVDLKEKQAPKQASVVDPAPKKEQKKDDPYYDKENDVYIIG